MKAAINNENKAKFFVLYWGQKVYLDQSKADYTLYINGFAPGTNEPTGCLQLKPLSSISDEDAVEVGYAIRNLSDRDWKQDVFSKEDAKAWIRGGMKPVLSINDSSEAIDYLRFKGYALPWMGLSVEEMCEAGWIKLTS